MQIKSHLQAKSQVKQEDFQARGSTASYLQERQKTFPPPHQSEI